MSDSNYHANLLARVQNAGTWWRSFYTDHPDKGRPNCPRSGSKFGVYCTKCLHAGISEILEADRRAGNVVRSTDVITRELFAVKATTTSGLGFRWSHPSTVLNHLKVCPFQEQGDRDTATILNVKNSATGPSNPAGHALSPGLGLLPVASAYTATEPSWTPGPPIPNATDASSVIGPQEMLSSTDARSIVSSGSLSTIGPSDSISNTGAGIRGRMRGLSRSASFPRLSRDMPPERQRQFEIRVTRLTSSAGLPLSWVDNPEWLALVEEFIPGATSPSRTVLSRRLIPSLAAELREHNKKEVKGGNATIQADGWTGINTRPLTGYMITVDGKVYTVRVQDTSTERKTAENFLEVMEAVYKELTEDWGLVVVAVCTDASGEALKARRLFGRAHPEVVVLDCYSHQVNLIVGNYFEVKEGVLLQVDKAVELINWIRSRTVLLNLIRNASALSSASGQPKTVIRAVLTRWTSHYMALSRLLELYRIIRAVITSDQALPRAQQKIAVGKKETVDRSLRMFKIVEDASFWNSITRVVRHLRPLAIAANAVQAAHCRLDTVILTFGSLYAQYTRNFTDREDEAPRLAILASLEKRWAKADQDVFIAAVVLNPAIMFSENEVFGSHQDLKQSDLMALLYRLWRRFYKSEPPSEFASQLSAYWNQEGFFRNLRIQVTIEEQTAKSQNRPPNPLKVYANFKTASGRSPPFVQLAERVLSISANSASCERLFSVFGNTLTKLRNRLGNNTLQALVELKMHIRDEHLRNEESKKRLKRHFGHKLAGPANLPQARAPVPSGSGSELTGPSAPLANMPSTEGHSSVENQSGSSLEAQSDLHRIALESQSAAREQSIDDGVYRPTGESYKIPLKDLFNYESMVWAQGIEESGLLGYNDELSIYELLDSEPDGDDDNGDGIEADETVVQTLS